MFILTEMQDIVKVEPWKFNLDMNIVIVDTLNNKFANKVQKVDIFLSVRLSSFNRWYIM